MKLTREENVVIFNNEKGEYHLSIDEFNKLGEAEAIKYAESEIEKKLDAKLSGRKITYDICRKFGFCKYGIKEYCEMVGFTQVDIDMDADEDRSYSVFTVEEMIEATTLEAFKKYPEEILKLTGKKIVDKWGGVANMIEEHEIYEPFLNKEFFTEIQLREIAVECAKSTLHFFEDKYPDDDRPRKAIEAAENVIKVMKEEGIESLTGY